MKILATRMHFLTLPSLLLAILAAATGLGVPGLAAAEDLGSLWVAPSYVEGTADSSGALDSYWPVDPELVWAQGAAGEKVAICHRPPGNPDNYRTIMVGASAVPTRLAKGDLLGACATRCPALCDDGNACTTDTSVWDAGVGRCACSSAPVVCAALDQCHLPGVCDPSNGTCSNDPKPNGTACSDGKACTQLDTCQAGVCVGAPVTCVALDQCHDAGVCDPASGACSNPAKPDGTPCADGTCVCSGGVPVALRPATCRQVMAANPGASLTNGVYTIHTASGEQQVYCDMLTDGGGWTALFIGRNGSTNVFDHFDAGAYSGTFSDPASLRYLQRAPASLGESASELAVSCGEAMVKFPFSIDAQALFVDGTQAGWQPLTPTAIAGTVAKLPNRLWGGSLDGASFIFTSGLGVAGSAGPAVFASSFTVNNAFDFCNGVGDQTSVVRILYREAMPTPVRNTAATARVSCRAIRDGGESAGDGIYWLAEPGAEAYQAYCDMTTDGGGWTAVFAGWNGSEHVFDHFDAGSHTGICTDPATHCLRRAPTSAGILATDLAVSCGGAMVKFPVTGAALDWLVHGTASGWQPLTPTTIAGTVAQPPNTLLTGNPNPSFIFTVNESAGSPWVFGSSFASSDSYDVCNGRADQPSLLRVYYR